MSTVPSHSFRRLLVALGLLSVVVGARAASAEEQQPEPPRLLDDKLAAVGALAAEFGGIYAGADGRAHLYLTDPSPAAGERAMVAVAEVFGSDWTIGSRGEVLADTDITIHRADYGFAQLKRWHDRMTPVLTLARVVFTDIDESANRLLVGVADRAAEGVVRDELTRLGIPAAALQIAVVPEVTTDSLQDSHTPKVAGLQITNSAGIMCTLGFNARRAGVAGFVTASHCTAIAGGVENTVFWQPGPPASCQKVCLPLAQETADPPFVDSSSNWLCPSGRVCRYSDAAFARYIFDSPLLFKQGHLAATGYDSIAWDGGVTFKIEGKWDPSKYSPSWRVARTTGTTESVVMITCANVNIKNTNKTMICQDKAPYQSAPGDSGAPMHHHGSLTALHGMHWGSGGWFSPISSIELELGAMSVCVTGTAC